MLNVLFVLVSHFFEVKLTSYTGLSWLAPDIQVQPRLQRPRTNPPYCRQQITFLAKQTLGTYDKPQATAPTNTNQTLPWGKLSVPVFNSKEGKELFT